MMREAAPFTDDDRIDYALSKHSVTQEPVSAGIAKLIAEKMQRGSRLGAYALFAATGAIDTEPFWKEFYSDLDAIQYAPDEFMRIGRTGCALLALSQHIEEGHYSRDPVPGWEAVRAEDPPADWAWDPQRYPVDLIVIRRDQ
jgi:hypothetical protein